MQKTIPKRKALIVSPAAHKAARTLSKTIRRTLFNAASDAVIAGAALLTKSESK